ncbi:MAG TPA: selenium-dependent molybdenum cofactor biosynthesis protein YqeB [Anaerolineales bacterium]|nr:selenium-dependent molybdenum cofactor biosynthesis protein YqeB [Anaerolineales bacterium]
MDDGQPILILRGGGDLASGVALRCFRAGFHILITEIPQPLAVRRTVAFAEAIYMGSIQVEEATGRKVNTPEEIQAAWQTDEIPVIADPECAIRHVLHPTILVDGRMTKQPPDLGRETAGLVIGLGPGFTAGINCHAVIETNRGHFLGRVLWDGPAQADTGIPEGVDHHQEDRVLRAPAAGRVTLFVTIGEIVEPGEAIAQVQEQIIYAPFKGLVRGLIHPGIQVQIGTKIGDLDPRCDPRYTQFVSEKALAVGGGVLEAALSRPDIRHRLLG